MLKIILNRLKPQAEKIFAEEHASFRAGRSPILSPTEQIFNPRILLEKYLQHLQDLYHIFIDFIKAFDSLWYVALWETIKKYSISANPSRVIKNIYDKATSAVLFNSSIGNWFRTTVGIRQGCLLSPTLFKTFLERITTDAVEDHEGTVSIGGRTMTNVCFADDIDGIAGEEKLAKLVECLDKASTAYGMEISAEKTKLMTNKTSDINKEIKINGQKLEVPVAIRMH